MKEKLGAYEILCLTKTMPFLIANRLTCAGNLAAMCSEPKRVRKIIKALQIEEPQNKDGRHPTREAELANWPAPLLQELVSACRKTARRSFGGLRHELALKGDGRESSRGMEERSPEGRMRQELKSSLEHLIEDIEKEFLESPFGVATEGQTTVDEFAISAEIVTENTKRWAPLLLRSLYAVFARAGNNIPSDIEVHPRLANAIIADAMAFTLDAASHGDEAEATQTAWELFRISQSLRDFFINQSPAKINATIQKKWDELNAKAAKIANSEKN